MPVELTEARLDTLREKRDSIRDRFESAEIDSEITDEIFDTVSEEFESIRELQSDFLNAREQSPESDAAQMLYRQYLRAMDRVAGEIQVLETDSVYLDLYEHQQSGNRGEYLERASAVCAELQTVFDVSPKIFPVIQEGYATVPLGAESSWVGDGVGSEVHVLTLPREPDTRLYEPLLMHELGHALFDEHPRLRSRLRTLARDRQSAQKNLNDLVKTWNAWFKELFCDVCGLLAYGPAYICALLRRLTVFDPFRFERGEKAEHPPDALRFDVLHTLARDNFPHLLHTISSEVTAFQTHLEAFDDERSPDYEVYDDDSLVEFVIEELPEALDSDLDALLGDIRDGVDPTAVPARRYRLEANRRLLLSYPTQNGG